MDSESINKVNLLKAVGLFAIALVFVLLTVYLSKWVSDTPDNTTNPPNVIEVPFTAVTCPSDTKSYEKTKADKNLVLLSNVSSYGNNGSFQKSYNVTITRSGLKSEIACGYLFYRISVGNKAISQKYENLFMVPKGIDYMGGHIIPSDTNTISNMEVGGKTEILLPLNNIYYDGTERQNFKQANWVALLNVANAVDFTIALNSQNTAGQIDSVEFAYKCWNPQTGQETNDCNLEVAR